MKKISEHLGEIIVALAGVALIIAACVVFRAPIGNFFGGIIEKETSVGNEIFANIEGVDLTVGGGGGSDTGAPVLLDGNGATVNKFLGASYSVRSSAPMGEFQEVVVNGETVDPSHYSVTEGSTIITFDKDYIADLSLGEQSIGVVSDSGTASGTFNVVNAIPENGELWTGISDTANYQSGNYVNGTKVVTDAVSMDPQVGDVFVYGDYEYIYMDTYSADCAINMPYIDGMVDSTAVGWNVIVRNSNQGSYGEILESINGKPVTIMYKTFMDCTNMWKSPTIPNTIELMVDVYYQCLYMEEDITIPNSVNVITTEAFPCFYGLGEEASREQSREQPTVKIPCNTVCYNIYYENVSTYHNDSCGH